MTAITINAKNHTIELTKTFATASSKFGTDEYNLLQMARKDYPNYKVVTIVRKAPKNDKPTFKGLTYEYMEKYIKAHDDKEGSNMAVFNELRGKGDDAEGAMADSMSYGEIKLWFLDTYPEIKNFHESRANRIKAIKEKQKKAAEEKAKKAA